MTRINPYDLSQIARERHKSSHAIIAELKAENEELQSQLKEVKEKSPDFLVSTAYVINELEPIHSKMQIRHWGSGRIDLYNFILKLKSQIKQ